MDRLEFHNRFNRTMAVLTAIVFFSAVGVMAFALFHIFTKAQ